MAGSELSSIGSGERAGRTRGVLYVHACPRHLSSHLEWALESVLGATANLPWVPQPMVPGALRAEAGWVGRPGTAAAIVSALRSWPDLRLEITEEPSPGCEGERYAMTPELGLFRATIGVHGDIQVGEDQLRALLGGRPGGDDVATRLESLLGSAWDVELEPFRCAGDGAPVRWLHRVG